MKLQDAARINSNAILVHSGVLFDVFNPNPEDIKIIDIAHALSNLCRYGGHSPKFYSVAQHCVLCSLQPGTPKEQMEYLLHDASEAYLVDMPRPIKRNLADYRRIEDSLLEVIFSYFKLTFPLTDKVHFVDNEMLQFEYKAFYEEEVLDPTFEFWGPEEAKSKFIARFEELKQLIAA